MDVATQGLSLRLFELFREELKRPIAADQGLLDCGLTINRALRIIARFWNETGIELDVNSVYAHPTLGALAESVALHGQEDLPKLIEIRPGSPDETLVVYAGGVSCFLEMQDLVDRLAYSGRVCGMALTPFHRSAQNPARVEDEIEASLQALDAAGVTGPYRLLGYSFGGIIALELARALQARGDAVAFLGLIDAPQGERCWPFPVWLRFMAKRARRRGLGGGQVRSGQAQTDRAQAAQAREPARRSLLDIPAALRRALRPLSLRFADPRSDHYPTLAPQWVGNYPPRYGAAGQQLIRMKGLYRPAVYAGALTFYRALGGSPVDCDPKAIWPRFLPEAEWVDMRGNHQSIIVGRNAAALADDISRRLGAI